MSEHVGLEFEAPTGDRLSFEWDSDLLARLGGDPPDRPVWTLGGELDWDEIERVRVLSARLGDDRLLAIVALLAAGADGHGEELVAAALGDRRLIRAARRRPPLGGVRAPRTRLRRIGLELYASSAALAIRLSGSVTALVDNEHGGVARTTALIELADGGHGILDVLHRP